MGQEQLITKKKSGAHYLCTVTVTVACGVRFVECYMRRQHFRRSSTSVHYGTYPLYQIIPCVPLIRAPIRLYLRAAQYKNL